MTSVSSLNVTHAIGQVVRYVIYGDAYRATKYISDKLVIKATRRHKFYEKANRQEVVVTIGAPNYLERKFIKLAKTEPLPIRNVQLKFK